MRGTSCRNTSLRRAWEKHRADSARETNNSKIIFILTYMIETVMDTNATKLKAPPLSKNKMQK